MATPNEIEILRIIQEQGKASKREVGKLMGISSGYAGFLMATMAKNGWLSWEKGVGHVLTPAGVDQLISEFMYSRERLVNRVEWMANEVEKIDKEVIKLESMKKGMGRVSEGVKYW